MFLILLSNAVFALDVHSLHKVCEKRKFNKEENSWVVLKGHSIMFIGGEDQCKTYINNFS